MGRKVVRHVTQRAEPEPKRQRRVSLGFTPWNPWENEKAPSSTEAHRVAKPQVITYPDKVHEILMKIGPSKVSEIKAELLNSYGIEATVDRVRGDLENLRKSGLVSVMETRKRRKDAADWEAGKRINVWFSTAEWRGTQ